MRNFKATRPALAVLAVLAACAVTGCAPPQQDHALDVTAGSSGDAPEGRTRTLTLAAFSAAKEAYQKEILPAFQRHWKAKTGENVIFRQTYEASGTQSRNIVNGLEADVASLSLAGDVEKIREAGLITHDWRKKPFGGMAFYSVVAIAARQGNPHGIRDWSDLTQPGVEILMPNPGTSGGAMWNVLAIYGAGQLSKAAQTPESLLEGVRRNVLVMDKSGRESFSTFEHGAGDVAVTYENEALRAIQAGRIYDLVIPPATIRVENPVAVIDEYADRHGVKEIGEAFVNFLYSDEAQRAFARHHFRPVQPEIAKEYADRYPNPPRLFTVEDLGGWDTVEETVFGPNGAWTQANNGARP